ncbi:hypothetical protein ECE50_004930 [Chitinophaga sp. Mgbs1]|uniref:Uncharacterized protein n=1 Tax=Chitinophaga solisilvae TaxID=1233460 RepID=A0A433WEA3_9BACT|nr:hypothetical protein [Chitinophaga solisilvae]
MDKPKIRGNAVVIGGSIAGILSARILADYFESVTIVEKDILPDIPDIRKSVPQAHHVHALAGKSLELIESWFPSITREMVASGAHLIDPMKEMRWYIQGVWFPRCPSDLRTITILRSVLEWNLLRRLKTDCPRVKILDNAIVQGLMTNKESTRIVGIEFRNAAGKLERIDAVLTIDASGRGSQTPNWLEAIGYERPPETQVEVNVGYTSRIYRESPDSNNDWKSLLIYFTSPDKWRLGAMANVQYDTWVVSLIGYFGDHAPLDEKGYLEFARSLTQPQIFDWLGTATGLSEAKIYKVKNIFWRHYEKLSKYPDGFLVIGDAACNFNPIFGRGITVITSCTEALSMYLSGGRKRSMYYMQRKMVKYIAPSWHLDNIINFSFSQTKGKCPLLYPYIWRLLEKLLLCSADNVRISQMFQRIVHMHVGVNVILNPTYLLPLIRYIIRPYLRPLRH